MPRSTASLQALLPLDFSSVVLNISPIGSNTILNCTTQDIKGSDWQKDICFARLSEKIQVRHCDPETGRGFD